MTAQTERAWQSAGRPSSAMSGTGMVSTSHPAATAAAVDALRQGGSAVDAYLAACAVQVVVEPVMTSLAGTLDVTVYDAETGLTTNTSGGFGRPAAEDGRFDERARESGRTVASPGWLLGAEAAWRRFGTLPWSQVYGHAIRIAREGFRLDPLLWGDMYAHRQIAARYPAGQAIWHSAGRLPGPYDVLMQPRLADTLERVAESDGVDWFYGGPFAERYAAAAQSVGGLITAGDLAEHRSKATVSTVVPSGHYRGREVLSAGGGAFALALQAAEIGDLRTLGPTSENPETLYLVMRLVEEAWAECARFDNDEPFIGDRVFTHDDSQQVWDRAQTLPPRPYTPITPGTCAIVVVDGSGNVALGTHSSSSRPFGIGLAVDGVIVPRPLMLYGDPVTVPAGINCAMLLLDHDRPALALASPSISCFTNVLQNALNVVEFGMDISTSVEQPLFGSPSYPSRRPQVEASFGEDALAHVTERGLDFQRVSPYEPEMGSCHAVHITEQLHGVADPRRCGTAQGL